MFASPFQSGFPSPAHDKILKSFQVGKARAFSHWILFPFDFTVDVLQYCTNLIAGQERIGPSQWEGGDGLFPTFSDHSSSDLLQRPIGAIRSNLP